MSITNHLKSILAGFGMLLLAFNVSAYPQLMFDGSVNYLAPFQDGGSIGLSGAISVEGTLTGSQDISSAPQLVGSVFKFGGLFDSVSTNAFGAVGSFAGISGPDLTVTDGASTLLLQGELSGLAMGGLYGLSGGTMVAEFTPTGGLLKDKFMHGAKLLSMQLHMTPTFSAGMFGQDFTGKVDGKLSAPVSVPEPNVLVLLLLGLGVLAITTRKKFGQKFGHHFS